MSKCRTCGAEILWCIMESGKKNPLDPEPHPEGTINIFMISDIASGHVVKDAATLEEIRRIGQPLYRSHFVTCPDSQKHRRKPK